MKKKIFVISDVHGHATLMRKALEEAGYRMEDPSHFLIGCGDYFDRGTENMEVLRYLERVKNKVLLRGNHEDLLLKVLRTGRMEPHNYINGTAQTLRSFFGPYALGDDGAVDLSGHTSNVTWLTEFIGETVDYFETAGHIFVHGWLPVREGESGISLLPDWRNAAPEVWAKARWTRWPNMQGVCPMPEKTVVCGHYPTCLGPGRQEGEAGIYYGKGFLAIDAGTAMTGQVNVLVLEDEL